MHDYYLLDYNILCITALGFPFGGEHFPIRHAHLKYVSDLPKDEIPTRVAKSHTGCHEACSEKSTNRKCILRHRRRLGSVMPGERRGVSLFQTILMFNSKFEHVLIS